MDRMIPWTALPPSHHIALGLIHSLGPSNAKDVACQTLTRGRIFQTEVKREATKKGVSRTSFGDGTIEG
jgi:hypothetical protein